MHWRLHKALMGDRLPEALEWIVAQGDSCEVVEGGPRELPPKHPPQPAALAEQEPVAWWHRKSNTFTSGNLVSNFAEWTPLYTAPQPAIPQSWTPTAENINALPESLRRYIADLETNADPAGTVRDLTIARDTIRALEASNRMLRDAAPEAPKPAKPAGQEPVAWCDQYEGHTSTDYDTTQTAALGRYRSTPHPTSSALKRWRKLRGCVMSKPMTGTFMLRGARYLRITPAPPPSDN